MSTKSILKHVYDNESKHPNKLWLTQPLPGGSIVTYTWKQAVNEARRIGSYLQQQGFEPGSKIAMLSKEKLVEEIDKLREKVIMVKKEINEINLLVDIKLKLLETELSKIPNLVDEKNPCW